MLPFETRSLSLSITFHAILLLVAAVGLPMLLPDKPDPMPLVMTVEIMPIGEMTNVKPSDKPIQEEQKAPTPKITKPVPPTAQEKPSETAKPQEKVKDPAPEEKKFDPMEGAEPKPAEKPKDEKKPDKPKEDSKTKTEDFEALLNKLKQENTPAQNKDAKDKTNTEANKTKSDAPYDASLPLSISEKDAIRSQFIPCWRMPAGSKDAGSLAVRVKATLQADGTVLTAVVAPDLMGRYNSDTFFRAAADSAVRAVFKCSPLKNLPADKYNSWKEMELNFDPADLM